MDGGGLRCGDVDGDGYRRAERLRLLRYSALLVGELERDSTDGRRDGGADVSELTSPPVGAR